MKQFKTALAAAALLVGMVGAHATPITVDGVTWDPDSESDFSAASVAMVQNINAGTGVVSGYGIVTTMNGLSDFCANCQLVFSFGGFTPTGGAIPVAGTSSVINYNGGTVSFYVVAAGTVASAGDVYSLEAAEGSIDSASNLFLSAANAGIFTGTTTGSAQFPSLSGNGFLNVTGGAAASNFDTNTEFDGSDLAFTNGFTNPLKPGQNILNMGGTGNLFGDTIPEPASLALVGIGLLGAGLARRKARR